VDNEFVDSKPSAEHEFVVLKFLVELEFHISKSYADHESIVSK
jgi:hypothetical protein